MIPGTRRTCAGGDHKVTTDGENWFHTSKADWTDHPHKAAPKKYSRKKV